MDRKETIHLGVFMASIRTLVQSSLPKRNAEIQLLWHFLCSASLVTIPLWIALDSLGWAFVVAQISLPIFYFRSFALMHDAVHGAVSKYRLLNHIAGLVGGTFCLLPYWPWKDLHIDHHKWAGNVEKDPVMKIVRDYESYSDSQKKLIRFCWRYWIPLPAMMQNVVFWVECVKRFNKGSSLSDRSLNALSLIVPTGLLGISFALGGWQLLLFAAPAFVTYLVMVEVINFPHHLSLPQSKGETKLSFFDQHQIARSCHYPKSFARLVLNNFNYHIEHHMFPHLPWFSLAEVREVVKPYLGDNYNESQANEWIVENRRNDLEKIIASTNENLNQFKGAA